MNKYKIAYDFIMFLWNLFSSMRTYYYFDIKRKDNNIIINLKTNSDHEVRNFNEIDVEKIIPTEINLTIIDGSKMLDDFMFHYSNKNYIEMKELMIWLKNTLNAYIDNDYLEKTYSVNKFTKMHDRVRRYADYVETIVKYYANVTLNIIIKQINQELNKLVNIEKNLNNLINRLNIHNILINIIFTIENKKSGKFVDVFASQDYNGTPIIEFDKTANSNQQFKIENNFIISVCNNKPIGWTKTDNIDYLQIKEMEDVKKKNQSFKITFVKQTTNGNNTKKWYNIEVANDSNWVWQSNGNNIVISKKSNSNSQLFCVNYI